MVPLEFFIDNSSDHTLVLRLTKPLTDMNTRNISWRGEGGQCILLTALPLSFADCLEILVASTFWSPKGLSRPVMAWLYLYLLPKLKNSSI